MKKILSVLFLLLILFLSLFGCVPMEDDYHDDDDHYKERYEEEDDWKEDDDDEDWDD